MRTQDGRGKLGQSESSIDIYTLPNVKWLASGKQQHSTGRSPRCFAMTYRGEIRRTVGRLKREGIWGHMHAYG